MNKKINPPIKVACSFKIISFSYIDLILYFKVISITAKDLALIVLLSIIGIAYIGKIV